jgi:hypothetical protein
MRSWLIRQAHREDLQTVLNILSMRVIWLHSRGSDQWSTFAQWPPKLTETIDLGHTWLVETTDHEPIGTITVTTSGDPDFWTPEELAAPSLYVAKLATVPPDYVPERATVPPSDIRGLGRLMLDWSVDYAARAELEAIRLDVWRTAYDLHRWYMNNGWTKVRTVELPHRKSGTLFERKPCRQTLPNLCEVPMLAKPAVIFSDD